MYACELEYIYICQFKIHNMDLEKSFDLNMGITSFFTACLFYGLEQGFPARGARTPWGARQHLRGCEMVIQIFVLHFCPVMLSSSCANSSAQSVSNYSMPNARPSIQPETMLISKKKVNTRNFSLDFKIGPHLDQGCHIGFFLSPNSSISCRGTPPSQMLLETSSGITGVCEIGDDFFFFWRSPLQ